MACLVVAGPAGCEGVDVGDAVIEREVGVGAGRDAAGGCGGVSELVQQRLCRAGALVDAGVEAEQVPDLVFRDPDEVVCACGDPAIGVARVAERETGRELDGAIGGRIGGEADRAGLCRCHLDVGLRRCREGGDSAEVVCVLGVCRELGFDLGTGGLHEGGRCLAQDIGAERCEADPDDDGDRVDEVGGPCVGGGLEGGGFGRREGIARDRAEVEGERSGGVGGDSDEQRQQGRAARQHRMTSGTAIGLGVAHFFVQ